MSMGSERTELQTTAQASFPSVAVVLQQVQKPLRCICQQQITGLSILGVHYFQTVRWIVVDGFDHLLEPNLTPFHRCVLVHANEFRNVDGLAQHSLRSQLHAFGDVGLAVPSSRLLDDGGQERKVSSAGGHLLAEAVQARTSPCPTVLIGLQRLPEQSATKRRGGKTLRNGAG